MNIEQQIEALWGNMIPRILKWPGKPWSQHGKVTGVYTNEERRTTPRNAKFIVTFEDGSTRFHNDLTPHTHLLTLQMEKLIEQADPNECLTSPLSYVREYKKWLLKEKVCNVQ
jgi:hypothetical protein